MISLPSSPGLLLEKLVVSALQISHIYQRHKRKSPGLVDCVLTALLQQYPNDLLLVTRNHCDFPVLLLDRVFVTSIDVGGDVLAIAFYRFNAEKAKECGL